MKTVFPNASAVAHRWAHQSQSSARYRDNFSFSGRELRSYSTVIGLRLRHPDKKGAQAPGAIIGEPFVFYTAESYSMTTNRHMGELRAATRGMESHRLPDLDRHASNLAALTRHYEEGNARKLYRAAAAYDAARKRDPESDRWGEGYSESALVRFARDYISRYSAGSLEAETAELIGAMAGLSTSQVATLRDKADKAAKAAKAAEAKRTHKAELSEARHYAEASDSEFRATFPRDGSRTGADDYHAKEGAEYARKLFRLAKAAKAEGWTRIAAKLKAREKEYRAWLAGRDARIVAAYRSGLAAEVIAWRNGGRRPAQPWRFDRFPAIKAALALAEARENDERRREAYAAWLAGGARPHASQYEPDSAERAAILADVAAERERFLTAVAAWDGAAVPHYGAPDYSEVTSANHRIKAAEEREAAERREAEAKAREAERFARNAEHRRAWLAGETDSLYPPSGGRLSDDTGGALIRAKGDKLETSWGADVPLSHAIKAFRFVKLLRERGETWRRNGRTVRVGVYQIDSVDAAGFDAGCHRINWPEIERLARELGVFAEAPADAREPSAHAA